MTRYAKTITAIVGAVAAWAATYFPDDPSVQKWVGLAVALATAVSVFAVPNTPPKGRPRRRDVSETGATPVGIVLFVAILAVALLLGFAVNHFWLLIIIVALLCLVL